MKVTSVLAALVFAIGIDTATAKCFQTGADYENRDTAKRRLREACENKNGALQGKFAAGEVKSGCVNISKTQKVDFSIMNQDKTKAHDLDDVTCTICTNSEIENCHKGSEYTQDNFKYRVDPNNGQC